jgi:hypothetical protein
MAQNGTVYIYNPFAVHIFINTNRTESYEQDSLIICLNDSSF